MSTYGKSVATPIVAPSARPEEEIELWMKNQVEPPQSPECANSPSKTEQIAQAVVLAMLFAVPALMCIRSACANDPDIWWHMRTGEWILAHHAVPRVDPFSGPLAGTPWVAYSWLFELLTVKLFQWLGLVGLVAYTAGMVLAITVSLHRMVRRLQGDFTVAVLLTFAAMYSMGHLYTPRPWLFTILLFVLELDILMHARRTGRLVQLAWLPVIFALWANLHIQFVNGLAVLGLALAEAVLGLWWPVARTRIRPVWLGVALLASVLATLVNPYGWHIYSAAYDLATQAGALNKISELQAIPFRNLPDFLILLLALGSAAALAWRRQAASFEIGLLAFAAVLSFRSQRDVWAMATVAAAILASGIAGREKAAAKLPGLATAIAVIAASVAVLAGFRAMHVGNPQLQTLMARSFPVRAVEVVRQKGYAGSGNGPLYNDFNWGGYLIWHLRVPVSIDGRQNLYGDQRIDRSLATWGAQPDWASDTQLTSAGLVIGPVKAPLTQLLRKDPRFQLAYEDDLAAVFVAAKASPAQTPALAK